MSKTALLAAAAALALTAGGASAAPSIGVAHGKISNVVHIAKGAKMLYNQNSGATGQLIDSQNFTSGTFSPTYNDSGADDFVVPKKTTWTVTEVDVTGGYFQGYGPAASENVIFYADAKGMPGSAVKGGTFNGIVGKDSSGSFAISLGKGVKLKTGTYWVAVVANKAYDGGANGEWGWGETGSTKGNPGMWQNPGGGFGVCPTWGTIPECISGAPAGDYAFDLQGTAKKKKKK